MTDNCARYSRRRFLGRVDCAGAALAVPVAIPGSALGLGAVARAIGPVTGAIGT